MGIREFESAVLAALPRVVAVVPRGGTALDELGDVLAERLLGALELTVDRPAVDIPHDTAAPVPLGTTWHGGPVPLLTVFARFAGRGRTRDDLNVINAADRAYAPGGTIVTTPPASRRRNRGRTS